LVPSDHDPNGDDMHDPGDDVTNVLLGVDEELGTGVSEMGSGVVGHTGLWNRDIVDFIKDEISKIESDGNAVVAFFGENVLNYNIVLGASGIYEMLIFFDNASYPVELTSGVYKSVMIDMIYVFLQGLTTRMNRGSSVSNKYVLSQAPDSEKEEKFHYFTSSFVFEIRDGDGNVVFYCEFGRIQDVVKFKSWFTYPRGSLAYIPEHPLLPYYLNDDGFLFTFFLTMKTMKIKRGIAYFEKCIQNIKRFRFDNVGRKRERAFQDKLIHLFTVQFSEMFHLSMVMPVGLSSGKKMYLPLYQIMQTEILQEIFIIFDAVVDDGGDRLSYRDFAMRLNQNLLKAVGGGNDLFGNNSEGSGPLMSIYQLLVYYTNALNDAFSSLGCLAQESGGDVSKKYTLDAKVDGPPYLSDVDIKFFFPMGGSGFDEYEKRIINSLFYLIAFLEERRYLRYSELFVGTVLFGSHTFNFFIDSESQKRIFGIRYAKKWNGLAGLLSADIKLNIVFQHHKNDDAGTITSYKGKFVMAFFDVACWEKSGREISKYQYSTKISDLKGRELGFGGPVDLMNIPSLGASLNESNALVYDQKEEREKVNKHEKDKVRRKEYLELARMVIENNRGCVDDELMRVLLENINTEIDNVGEGNVVLKDWTKLDCLKNIDALPLEQLRTICAIEQVAYDGVDRGKFESNKMHFIEQIRRSFEIRGQFDATHNFLGSLVNNKAKTSYREAPVNPDDLFRGSRGGGGGSGARRRRKRRGVTKKQKRRLGGTRRR
jgi:hypothetical protein